MHARQTPEITKPAYEWPTDVMRRGLNRRLSEAFPFFRSARQAIVKQQPAAPIVVTPFYPSGPKIAEYPVVGRPMFEVDYCDQAGAQPPIAVGSLSWSEGVPITARLLIAERVRREFERFDPRGGELPAALVTPSANTRALDEVIETVLRAFSINRFFLLVDRRQIVDLDTPFPLTPASSVVFLRLTPLKGG
jgi:hypothetical protein